MRRTILRSSIVTLTAITLSLGGGVLGASRAGASDVPIVDTLGTATPATQFGVSGSGGIAVLSFQYVGPRFTLAEATVITEIGGFVNNFTSSLPFTVQIRPSVGGVPDPSTILATIVLSSDNDPLVVSFESSETSLTLEPGTYFALFAPEDEDQGFLLNTASDPFNYLADLTTMGFLDPTTGASSASEQFGAVRILGRPVSVAVQVGIDVKPGSSTNPIELAGSGKIPVAILATSTFDAATVDPTSVCFGDADAPSQRDCAAAHSTLKDVNGDGRLDLLLFFETRQTGIDSGDTQACLTGTTLSGTSVEGCDIVKT
jgi:hypothetical protein